MGMVPNDVPVGGNPAQDFRMFFNVLTDAKKRSLHPVLLEYVKNNRRVFVWPVVERKRDALLRLGRI